MTIDGGTGGAQNSPGSPLTRQEFSVELRKSCIALRTEIVHDIEVLLGNRVMPNMKELNDGTRPLHGIEATGRSAIQCMQFPTFTQGQTSQESRKVDAKDSELRVQGEIKDVAAMPESTKVQRETNDVAAMPENLEVDAGFDGEASLEKDGKDELRRESEGDVVEAWQSSSTAPDSASKSRGSLLDSNRRDSRRKPVTTTPIMKSTSANAFSRTATFYKLVTAKDENSEGGCIFKVVSSDYFDYGMGAILVLNAIVIGVQVDVMARSLSKEPDETFKVIDLVFCIVFTLELALRLCAFGCQKFLTMSGWKWNLFDVLIVSFGLVDEITKLALQGSEVQDVIDSLGVLRMLRLGRILRLVRMVRLIPALKSMVYLIAASMLSFFWTGVLLIIFMYCVAVYFTELCTEFVHKQTDLPGVTRDDFSDLKQQWGSVGQSVMSLFQAITGGDDWKNLVSGFKADDSSYSVNVVILSLYIAFAMLVMLNLVTGVFVEGAQKMGHEEKEAELVRTVRKLVESIDGDGNGDISWEEFEDHLDDALMVEFLKGFDMNSNQARDIFHVLDRDGSGCITMDEFITATISLRGPTKMADTEVLKYGLVQSFGEVHKRLDSMEQLLGNILRVPEQQSSVLPALISSAATPQTPQASQIHPPIVHTPPPQYLVSAPAPLPGMLPSHPLDPLDGYPRLFFVGTTEMEV